MRALRRIGAIIGWLSVVAAGFAGASASVGRTAFAPPSLEWLAAAAAMIAGTLLVWALAWGGRGRRGYRDSWIDAGLPLLVSLDAWLIVAFQYAHEPTNHLFATGLVTTDLIAKPSIVEWLVAKHVAAAVIWASWPRAFAWRFDDAPARPARPHPALVALAILAVAAYLRIALLDVLAVEVPSDLRVNYVAALAMRDGLNPYDNDIALQVAGRERVPFVGTRLWTMVTNPPTAMLYFVPYSLMPLSAARLAFLAVNHLALWGGLALVWRLVRPRLHWSIWLAAMLGAAAILDPIMLVLRLGQVDVLIMVLLTGAALRLRRGDDLYAGGLIALAAGLKLAPALLVLYLIWRGRWRALVGAVIGGAAVFGLSVLLAGVETWRFYLTDRLPDLLAGSPLTNNISVPGLILRVFMGPELAQGFLDRQPTILPAQVLSWVAVAAVVLAAGWALGRRAPTGSALALEFWLAVAVTLAIAGVSWPHTLTWLLPLVGWLLAGRLANGSAVWPAATIGAGLALAAIPMDVYAGLFSWVFDRSVIALSIRGIGVVLIVVGMLVAVRGSRPTDTGDTSSPTAMA